MTRPFFMRARTAQNCAVAPQASGCSRVDHIEDALVQLVDVKGAVGGMIDEVPALYAEADFDEGDGVRQIAPKIAAARNATLFSRSAHVAQELLARALSERPGLYFYGRSVFRQDIRLIRPASNYSTEVPRNDAVAKRSFDR